MIDPDARAARIVQAAADPTVGVVLLDVVLGHGAHPDPAGAVAAAVREARAAAHRPVKFIASICGTAADPQGFDAQAGTLRAAGVLLAGSNAAAARLAIRLAGGADALTDPATTRPPRTPCGAAAPRRIRCRGR
jgi:FdrA protein